MARQAVFERFRGIVEMVDTTKIQENAMKLPMYKKCLIYKLCVMFKNLAYYLSLDEEGKYQWKRTNVWRYEE